MPPSNRSFDRMIIPAPCDADWDSMIGNERVRFCEHCNLHVTNVSALTRLEATRLVSRSEGRLCVRFVKRLDGSIVTKQLPQKLHQIGRRVSRIAAGAFTATLSLSSAAAQSAPSTSPPLQGTTTTEAVMPQLGTGCTLTGIISDPSGATIPGATVTLLDPKMGSSYSFTTAEDGMYKFALLPAGSYRLMAGAPSFESSSVDQVALVDGVDRSLNVELKLPEIVAEVSIQTDAPTIQYITSGVVAFLEPEEPLIKAAFQNDLDAVKELMFSTDNIDVRDKYTRLTALEHAVENGNLDIVRTLLAAGAKINAKDPSGRAALSHLRAEATPELVRELLLAGARVNARDESGGTPLMYAADSCTYEVVKELLEAGAKVDLKDADGKTALMFAATRDNPRIAKMLIDEGAEVNAKDKQGKTPLMFAAEMGDPEVLKLLVSFSADVNARDENGRTPLMYIAETSDVESARALLNAGADLSVRNKDGQTALTLARESQHEEMAKLLEGRGAPE